MENLTEDERMAELEAQMFQGNHQAARKKLEKIKKKSDQDIKYWFAVPINTRVVFIIPGLAVNPCNLDTQFTLTETIKRVEKDRLTHNLSISLTRDNTWVNSRSVMNQYPEMIYASPYSESCNTSASCTQSTPIIRS